MDKYERAYNEEADKIIKRSSRELRRELKKVIHKVVETWFIKQDIKAAKKDNAESKRLYKNKLKGKHTTLRSKKRAF